VLAAATKGWDTFTARLTTAFRSGEGWVGLYDGSADVSENYEERCGMARSEDLRSWERMGRGPAVGASGGPGTVRYVESVVSGERRLFFFECTRRGWGARALHERRAAQRIGPRHVWLMQKTWPRTTTRPTNTA
jgi:hypothetical protein